jgi:uroporphyrin-III C-methyltransferase/precorrin-2 dehydrogenase/sirohydrochlorin ferrochelatase
VDSLPIFLRLAGKPVILVGDGHAAEARRRILSRASARLVGEEDRDARLAFVAIDEDAQAEAVVARLRARGLLVNSADKPALCDFTMPAIVDRAPVLVAIGTGGASAGLAKALRGRIEALLPASLGALASALGAAKDHLRARFPENEKRRHAVDTALAPGGALDPVIAHGEEAVQRWLDAGAPVERATRLERIRLRSPDPDDLTLREARLLSAADRVYHRPDVPLAVLDRIRADAARISCPEPPMIEEPGLAVDLGWASS